MHPSFSFKTQRSSQIQEQRRIRWKSKRTSTVLSTSVYIWHKTNKERSLNKTFIPSKESRGIREWNEDRHHCQPLTFFPSLSNETSVKSHCQSKQSTDGKISTKREREREKQKKRTKSWATKPHSFEFERRTLCHFLPILFICVQTAVRVECFSLLNFYPKAQEASLIRNSMLKAISILVRLTNDEQGVWY